MTRISGFFFCSLQTVPYVSHHLGLFSFLRDPGIADQQWKEVIAQYLGLFSFLRWREGREVDRPEVIAQYLGLFSFLLKIWLDHGVGLVCYSPVSRALLIFTVMSCTVTVSARRVIAQYLGLFSFLHLPQPHTPAALWRYSPVSRALLIFTRTTPGRSADSAGVIAQYLGLFSFLLYPSNLPYFSRLTEANIEGYYLSISLMRKSISHFQSFYHFFLRFSLYHIFDNLSI